MRPVACSPPSARAAAASRCVRSAPRTWRGRPPMPSSATRTTPRSRPRPPPRTGASSRALDLLAGTALAVRERVNAMLAALPTVNPRDLHALGDSLGRDETAFAAFVDAVRDWLSARISVAEAEPRRLDRMAEVWEKLNATRARRDGLQSRTKTVGLQRVRLACRRHARLIRPAHVGKAPLLHHDRDRVPERPAAHRPWLRGHRDRRDRALQAARRLRRVLPHRHRRARQQDRADRRARTASRRKQLVDRNSRASRRWRSCSTPRTTSSSAPPSRATTHPRRRSGSG